MNTKALKITPFDPIHQDATRQLILNGLGEHWGWIDERINIDLEYIATSYSNGDFVLGWIGETLTATGVLIQEDAHSSRPVRMSINAKFRRQGYGVQILEHLLTIARQQSKKRVVLETTVSWEDVIKFYQSKGFQIDSYRNGDVHMSCEINSTGNLPIYRAFN